MLGFRMNEELLYNKIFPEPMSGCWLWTGALNYNGYGTYSWAEEDGRHTYLAHRLVYIIERGPIPDGLQLDHLCRLRCCVNPDHLEPVTSGENARRGVAWRKRFGIPRHRLEKDNPRKKSYEKRRKALSKIRKKHYQQ